MIIIDHHNGRLTISGNCLITKKLYSVNVSKEEYLKWKDGEHIQKAMPNVSAEDREFLVSGIAPQGWNEMFAVDIIFDEIREWLNQIKDNDSLPGCIENQEYVKAAAILVKMETERRKNV